MNKPSSLQIVLSIIDPEYPFKINLSDYINNKPLLKSSINFADKNGLYYKFISDLNVFYDLIQSEDQRWIEEKQKLEDFKQSILILNNSSKASQIDYILIKACTTVPHIPRDVDVYINSKNQDPFVRALEKNGMECVHSDDVDTTLIKGKNMKVDLYTGLCYFTFEFIDDEFLWNSCVQDSIFGIRYPGLKPEANFLILLVHSLFGHTSMSLLDFLHMKSLLEEISDVNICRNYAYKNGWGKAFDLAYIEFENIHAKIYNKGEFVSFPYFFDRKLVFQCIYGIEKLSLTKSNKIFLHISIYQDLIILILKNTIIYNLLRSFGPSRKLIGSFGYYIRNMRGDKRSN